MPNTLGHMGVQGLLTRGLLKDADLKWIYLGCVIPDLPWIGQRLLRTLSDIDRLDLRLYAVVQSSLLFCLLLGLVLALPARRPGRVFSILALGSLLHLLLDAAQIKWANGVILLAPLDWRLIHYGQFWPEQWPTLVLTGLGLVYLLWHWREALRTPLELVAPRSWRWPVAGLLLLGYALLPLVFVGGPAALDSHYVNTLRQVDERPGRYLELDRARFHPDQQGGVLEIYTGERLRVQGLSLEEPTKVSVKGRFIAPDILRVETVQVHGEQRDVFSIVGLGALAVLWGVALWRSRGWTADLRGETG